MQIKKMTEQEYVNAEKIYSPDPLLDPNPLRFDEERVKRNYKTLRHTFGIFENEKVIGYLSLKPTGEIGILMLNDHFKGKGYGTLAVKEALKLAENNAIATVFAETDEKNTPMRKILENLGFSKTKTFTKIVPPSLTTKTFIRYERSRD